MNHQLSGKRTKYALSMSSIENKNTLSQFLLKDCSSFLTQQFPKLFPDLCVDRLRDDYSDCRTGVICVDIGEHEGAIASLKDGGGTRDQRVGPTIHLKYSDIMSQANKTRRSLNDALT